MKTNRNIECSGPKSKATFLFEIYYYFFAIRTSIFLVIAVIDTHVSVHKKTQYWWISVSYIFCRFQCHMEIIDFLDFSKLLRKEQLLLPLPFGNVTLHPSHNRILVQLSNLKLHLTDFHPTICISKHQRYHRLGNIICFDQRARTTLVITHQCYLLLPPMWWALFF